jgi:flagellar FliL protein
MAEAEAEQEVKKKNPLILFIIIGVLLVGASIGGTIFFLGGSGGDETEEVVEEPDPEAIYFALNPKFKTNYEVNGRPRLFQVAITLVTREQDVIDALGLHSPTIKSRLVILLSGQKYDELQTPEGREALRAECLAAVQKIMNDEIGKPGVEKVLFTDFVMQ